MNRLPLHIFRHPIPALAFKPWRLLGFGYYQAWVYLAVLSTVLFPNKALLAEHLAFTRQYFSLSLSLCLVALVFVSYRLDILQKRHYILVGGSILSLVGTGIIALASAGAEAVGTAIAAEAPLVLIVSGITLTSIGNALLIICWGDLWCRIDTDRMAMHIIVANCFAGILYLVITALPTTVTIIATALLPLASSLTLLNCTDEPPRHDTPLQHQPLGLLLKAVAVIALIPFVYGIARAFSSSVPISDFDATHRSIVMGITGLALAIMLISIAAPRERIIMRLYRMIVPLMIVGFMAYSFAEPSFRWLALAAIACGFYSFEGLVWLLHPAFVLKTRASSLVVFGWGRALFHLCGFAGATAGFFLVNRGLSQGSSLNIICLAIVVVLVAVMAYVFTEHDLRLFIGRPPSASQQNLEVRCHELAHAFGLSKREQEVLVLLAKGRSVPFIAEEFTVSKGTVKTHVRHIYEKLGIHNKQELLDLVEKTAA